jgi:predicted ATP-dependent serine protease
MAYYCNDCSYRSKTSGQGGKCAACGSFNMSATGMQTQEKVAPSLWHKIALVSSWTLLIVLIIWKLIN